MISSASELLRLSAPGDGGSISIDGTSRLRSRASRATWIVSFTVSEGNRPAFWKARPRPNRARRWAGNDASGFPLMAIDPLEGTNPLTAFIMVDLPAPFVPIRPTTSPASTVIEALSTARTPPKCTDRPSTDSAGTPQRLRSDATTAPPQLDAPAAEPRARRPGSQPVEQIVTPGLDDLDQPSREVHQQDQQTDTAGEQPHLGGVVDQHRQGHHHSAPSTAPSTDATPPITAMATMRSDSCGGKRASPNWIWSPANRPPANEAIAPASANAPSFVRAGDTV